MHLRFAAIRLSPIELDSRLRYPQPVSTWASTQNQKFHRDLPHYLPDGDHLHTRYSHNRPSHTDTPQRILSSPAKEPHQNHQAQSQPPALLPGTLFASALASGIGIHGNRPPLLCQEIKKAGPRMCQYPIGNNDAARGKATTPSTTSEAPRASDLLSHSASQQRKAPKRTACAKA